MRSRAHPCVTFVRAVLVRSALVVLVNLEMDQAEAVRSLLLDGAVEIAAQTKLGVVNLRKTYRRA
eukprot:3863284-Pleurochrysis_carterae.AAC.2